MTNGKRIQSNLKTLLYKHGLEQRQLAEMSGLSVRTISEMTNNKTLRYSRNALERIAAALGIDDINEIITIVDDE